MTSSSESNRYRRLGRAVQAFLSHREAPQADADRLLAQNEEVRDLLEPLLRGQADPDTAQDPPPSGSAQGAFLGGFRLIREIGRGGMGVVYEAEEFALGRRVALKVLPNRPSLTARQIQRFRREAAAAARLTHRGIVPVFSVGEVDGTHYFAMEFVDGKSLGRALADLKERCADQPARLDACRLACIPGPTTHEVEAAEIVAQAAEAVAAAHAGGVLHRDLKPHNILIDRDGCVRVVDFGLAKDLVRGSITRSGEVAGTPHYMSPEQALGGRGVDARTDVFALGVVLYELLTLRVPFPADTPHEVLHAIVTRDPEPPRRLNPRVPRDLETVCLKAMESDAHYRYRTADELAAELRRFLRLEPIVARSPGSVTRLVKLMRRRKAAALAVLLGFFALVVLPSAFAIYQRAVSAQLAAQESETARERDHARTNLARARRVLEQQLERVEQLGREPGMEAMHRQMAEDALAFYQEFLAQPRTEAGDTELERQALSTHVLVARIHLSLGDHQRALAVVAAALSHLERLRAAGVDDATLIAVHTDALRHRAAARRMAGQPGLAEADLRAALAQQEHQLAREAQPGSASTRRTLAQVLFDLSSAQLQDGAGSDEAAQLLARARSLMDVEPVTPGAPRDGNIRLAILRKQGEVLRRTGRYAEAVEVTAAAMEQASAAAAAHTPEARADLGTVTMEHGNVLLALHRVEDAEAAFRAAIALREALVRDFPRTQQHRHGLQVVLYNLALLLHNHGRSGEAREAVQRAAAINDELLAESPGSAVFADQAGQVANLFCLIESNLRPDDVAAVEAAHRAATARHEEMVAKHPDVVKLRSGLGAACHNQALWLLKHRRYDEAHLLLERAIVAQEAAHAADPQVQQYRDFLYNHWQLESQCQLARRDAAAAAVATRRAASLHPDRADVLVAMAQRLVRCAGLARSSDDAAAASYEDEALALLGRAVAADADRARSIADDRGLASLRARPEFRALMESAARR